jgi:hypothetical protein
MTAVTALLVTGAAATASADVQLKIKDGRVTLVAKDATVRQILTEWARVGQTKVVNVEKIPGGPVTLELPNVPEQQALRVLLKSVGGYIAAPRMDVIADASLFDRIVVMPVAAQAPVSTPAAAAAAPPAFQAFQPPQQQFPIDDDRDEGAQPPQPANRSPVFVFPQPPGGAAPQQPVPAGQMPPPQPNTTARPAFGAFPGAPTGNAPTGVAVPGMVVPTPQPQVQPGVAGQPGTPFQPGQPFQQAPKR